MDFLLSFFVLFLGSFYPLQQYGFIPKIIVFLSFLYSSTWETLNATLWVLGLNSAEHYDEWIVKGYRESDFPGKWLSSKSTCFYESGADEAFNENFRCLFMVWKGFGVKCRMISIFPNNRSHLLGRISLERKS